MSIEHRPSFVKNTLILTAAGFLARGLGAVYRIFLSRVIQDEGMGLYQMAYNVFAVIITISLMGFPIAISKIVAEKTVRKDHRGAHRVFLVSLVALILLGLASSAVLYMAADFLANRYLNEPRAYLSLIVIAPAALILSIAAAFRGYFQGLQEMVPRAASDIIEQIARVGAILFLAVYLIGRGIEYGSAGAALGVVVGAAMALAYLVLAYFLRRHRLRRLIGTQQTIDQESVGSILRRLTSLAVPVTLGSLIWPVMQFLDVMIVSGQLQHAGFAPARATELYGQLSGQASPLVNMPTIITMALAASLVPSISEAVAVRNYSAIRSRTSLAIKLTVLLGLPATIGIYLLANPLAEILFANLEAGPVIAAESLVIVSLLLYQTSTGVLQGIGKTAIPVINLCVGAIPKVMLTYWLTSIPSINVRGAAWATVVGFGIAAALNMFFVFHHTGISISWWGLVTAPMIAVGVMAMAVTKTMNKLMALDYHQAAATGIAIVVGALIYGFLLLMTGSLGREELLALPKIGRPIVEAFNRIGLMRGKK